jgi:transcriptional regulator with XRE-family HTH domain
MRQIRSESTPANVLIVDLGSTDTSAFIRRAFTLSGCTQRRFAATMGMSSGALSDILSGKGQSSREAMMASVAAAMCLGVSMRVPLRLTATGKRGKRAA